MPTKAARVLMYTQDSYGLGHLRRATTLANALVTERPDLSILLVVDSPVAPFFELHDRIDFVKLPTVVKVGAGVFRPGRLRTSYGLVKAMRATVTREVLARLRPDLVLVDHMPGGANRELVPALRLLRSLDHPTRVVLGVRDIIDNPAVTCEVWEHEGFYDTLRRYYDSMGRRTCSPRRRCIRSTARCPATCTTADTSATWTPSRIPSRFETSSSSATSPSSS